MENKDTHEEKRKELKEIIKRNNKTDFENYIIEKDINLSELNSNEFDILIYAIENEASLEIINFIINQDYYECLNYVINDHHKDKVPLFSALLKNKFDVSDLLLKNKADINYSINNKDDGDVINYLYRHKKLGNRNLKYILCHGYDTYYLFNNINCDLMFDFIRSFKNTFLEIIFKHYIFDNAFVLSLLKLYKNGIALSKSQLQNAILKEKNKLKIKDSTYESYYRDAAKEDNHKAIKIIFENDCGEPNIIFRRINLYDILERAVKLNDYHFVKKVLWYDSFSFKSIISEQNLLEVSENNNMNIMKLLIEKALTLSSTKSNGERETELDLILDTELDVETETDTEIDDNTVKLLPMENQMSYYLNLILNMAIESKNITLVKYLLENEEYSKYIDLNTKNFNDEYPIITAFYANTVEIFRYLLEKGANANTKNKNETSLLSLVIDRYNYNVKFIKYLFDYHVNINEKDSSGNYPLIKAINKNDFDSVILLIKYGIKNHIDMNVIDVNGNTPLTLSYKIEHLDIFKFLVKYLDVNKKDANGNSILYYAILNNDLETSKYLISNRADINFIDKHGNSAFDISLYKCYDLVSVFINNKNLLLNKPNVRGETPLISIIKSINSSINKEKSKISYYYLNISFKIVTLIERGSDVNAVDKEGNTPLVYAIQKKSLSVVMHLIKNGANINFFIRNRNQSIVMYAIELNRVDIVKFLIKCGANINFRNENDINVLISSSKTGKTKIFEYLVKNNVNDFTSEIVNKIIVDNRLDLLTILIDNNFNINLKDSGGNTPLVYALKCRNFEIIEYLINHGADCHNINEKDETIDSINYKYYYEYGLKDSYKTIYKLINNYR